MSKLKMFEAQERVRRHQLLGHCPRHKAAFGVEEPSWGGQARHFGEEIQIPPPFIDKSLHLRIAFELDLPIRQVPRGIGQQVV